MSLVETYARKLESILHETLPSQPNETEFRKPIDRLLDDFCSEAGLTPLVRAECTLGTGRADTVFNRLVIEYERPGALTDRLTHKATQHAVDQVKRYITQLARRERHETSRVAGVAFDGYYMVFVRYRAGDFVTEPPASVTRPCLERFLQWLHSLSSGLALTAENLNRDFAIGQLRTQNILRALTQGLRDALHEDPDGMVAKLFGQWRLFFSESIDYSEAFGGRKLEPLQAWVQKAGLVVRTSGEAEQFFFALHTYFAILAKFLAWLVLSRHIGVKLGTPSFGELTTMDSDTLRRRLEEMESGGIFRAFGIANLLEGDFFAWYLYGWNKAIDDALRQLLKRLDEYDPATLSIVPEETRDLFKQLYHYLLPREIRHNLGEYYTPDWLAQRLLNQLDNEFFAGDPSRPEQRLRDRLLRLRWLDPACGSGTFLTLIMKRMRELGSALMVNETELLTTILGNVVGFDLNPLAVLTARINYLLAIEDLLPYRKSEITIPVYLADSVYMPTAGADLYSHGALEFPTAVGKFLVPKVLCTQERFDRFTTILEESLKADLHSSAFVQRVGAALHLAEHERTDQMVSQVTVLYGQLLDLRVRGFDGLWARLLRNNSAPLTVGQFDYIVGNPPWVNWENLPDAYRNDIKPIWKRYGLFPHGGMDTILGKGKKDIAMLMTYTVADKLLKVGGRLGFVITQSVFKTAGAGQGFRRFRISNSNGEDLPLRVIHVDDMTDLQPFEGASNRTSVMILRKGDATTYPVPYTIWRKVKGERFTYDSTLEEVTAASRMLNFLAQPVDAHDHTSPWLTARRPVLQAIRKVLGKSDYEAHEGANSGGANAVYWVEIALKRPDGLVVVRNLTEGARVKVDEMTETIEPDLLYPLLRARDVGRWRAEPSAFIIMVQDPQKRRGIDEMELQARQPRTYGYLKRFEKVLRSRTSRGITDMLKKGAAFYTMFGIGDYTFTDWKVVWPNIASELRAAVIGKHQGKTTIPQHIVTLVACDSVQEAHYLCAVVNSSIANLAARAYSQEGGKSFGDPHVLEHIHIPRFRPRDEIHQRLAALSQEAHKWTKADDKERITKVEEEIDQLAAQLWGLSEKELREIQRSLMELKKG